MRRVKFTLNSCPSKWRDKLIAGIVTVSGLLTGWLLGTVAKPAVCDI
jgi:hypothetical protein